MKVKYDTKFLFPFILSILAFSCKPSGTESNFRVNVVDNSTVSGDENLKDNTIKQKLLTNSETNEDLSDSTLTDFPEDIRSNLNHIVLGLSTLHETHRDLELSKEIAEIMTLLLSSGKYQDLMQLIEILRQYRENRESAKTKNEKGPVIPNCSLLQKVNCIANLDFPSVDKKGLNPSMFVKGTEIAGIRGDLETCTSSNELGCITHNSFLPIDVSKVDSANIKKGTEIAGIIGSYSPDIISHIEKYDYENQDTHKTWLNNFSVEPGDKDFEVQLGLEFKDKTDELASIDIRRSYGSLPPEDCNSGEIVKMIHKFSDITFTDTVTGGIWSYRACANLKTQGLVSSGISSGADLFSDALVVRYFIDEASTGTNISQLLDSAPAPYHLDMEYDGSNLFFRETNSGRGLRFVNPENVPKNQGSNIQGSKIQTMLDSNKTITIEVVVEAEGCSTPTRFLWIDHNSNLYGSLGLICTESGSLDLRFGNQTYNSFYNVLGKGRVVITVVIDTQIASNNVFFYENGKLVGNSITITQDLTTTIEDSSEMRIGNRPDGNRPFDGSIYYIALYGEALSQEKVLANSQRLLVNDDKD